MENIIVAIAVLHNIAMQRMEQDIQKMEVINDNDLEENEYPESFYLDFIYTVKFNNQTLP